MRGLYRMVWVAALLSIIGMSCWFLTAPKAAPVVAPLVSYVSSDKSLSLQHPGDWKPHYTSSQAVSNRIFFDPDSVTHFAIDTSLMGSLIGDMLRPSGSMNMGGSGEGGGEQPSGGESSNAALSALQGMPGVSVPGGGKQKSPLEVMHEAELRAMEKNRSRYPDFAQGATQRTQIDGQEALATEFTFKQGDLWGKQEMVGTYITVLQKDREVDVTATCSKESQKTLKPVFDRMIASIRIGQIGG